jgi:hypothetical protein
MKATRELDGAQVGRLATSIRDDLDKAVRRLRDAQKMLRDAPTPAERATAVDLCQVASVHVANLFAAIWDNPNCRSALTGDVLGAGDAPHGGAPKKAMR